MTERKDGRKELVTRVTFPTSSFSISRKHQTWIEAEARRRHMSKSEFVRTLFDLAMQETEKAA